MTELAMAKFINVDDLEEGMALAEPVLNNFGQVLLPSGVLIKESHKKLLRTWNIRVLAVKTGGESEENVFGDDIRTLATEKLGKRLRWVPKTQFEIDLFNVGVLQECKILSKSKG